jgi:hypothetical protein
MIGHPAAVFKAYRGARQERFCSSCFRALRSPNQKIAIATTGPRIATTRKTTLSAKVEDAAMRYRPSARAIAAMCSGVEPQQPPTMLAPLSTYVRTCSASISGSAS